MSKPTQTGEFSMWNAPPNARCNASKRLDRVESQKAEELVRRVQDALAKELAPYQTPVTADTLKQTLC